MVRTVEALRALTGCCCSTSDLSDAFKGNDKPLPVCPLGLELLGLWPSSKERALCSALLPCVENLLSSVADSLLQKNALRFVCSARKGMYKVLVGSTGLNLTSFFGSRMKRRLGQMSKCREKIMSVFQL